MSNNYSCFRRENRLLENLNQERTRYNNKLDHIGSMISLIQNVIDSKRIIAREQAYVNTARSTLQSNGYLRDEDISYTDLYRREIASAFVAIFIFLLICHVGILPCNVIPLIMTMCACAYGGYALVHFK